MKLFRLMALLLLALALSAPASRASDDKPGEADAAAPSAQADGPASPDAAQGEKAETEEVQERSADNDNATDADPAATASTASEPKPEEKPAAKKAPLMLTIASWGGAYAKSQELAFIEPFREATGATVTLVDHGGDFDALKTGGSSPAWDVVDLGQEELEKACSAGLLERISLEDIAAAGDGTLPREDFLPGGVQDCGVASVAWSAAITFDTTAFEGNRPKTAADFFDVETFPGDRAVPEDPKYLLPLALMADGVAPGEVHKTLGSEEGLKRALTKLESIRNDVVWWQRPDQPLKLLGSKSATMAIAFSGQIFYAIVRGNRPFNVIWDGQVYDLDLWAVPKDAPNREAALKFIAFSIQPERLAAQTKWFPYGPMRKSALTQVGRHAIVDVEMREHIPTAEENFGRALRFDPAWWADHSERLTAAFEKWRATPAPAQEAEQAESGAEADAEDGEN